MNDLTARKNLLVIDDDTFFCPSDDGKSGYISLTREGEGYGKADIYKIRFK